MLASGLRGWLFWPGVPRTACSELGSPSILRQPTSRGKSHTSPNCAYENQGGGCAAAARPSPPALRPGAGRGRDPHSREAQSARLIAHDRQIIRGPAFRQPRSGQMPPEGTPLRGDRARIWPSLSVAEASLIFLSATSRQTQALRVDEADGKIRRRWTGARDVAAVALPKLDH